MRPAAARAPGIAACACWSMPPRSDRRCTRSTASSRDVQPPSWRGWPSRHCGCAPLDNGGTDGTDDVSVVTVDLLAEAGRTGPAFLLVDGSSRETFLLTEPDPEQLTAAVPVGHSADWAALDVSVLHTLLVGACWQLPDDVEHVGFAHSVGEAIHEATSSGGTAVLLNPTPVEAVAAVAGAGERMPRKSTLFTPQAPHRSCAARPPRRLSLPATAGGSGSPVSRLGPFAHDGRPGPRPRSDLPWHHRPGRSGGATRPAPRRRLRRPGTGPSAEFSRSMPDSRSCRW